jgi:methionyl-tRNA formyltransferase
MPASWPPLDLHGHAHFAVPTLLELVAHGHEVGRLYPRAEAAGRGMKLQATPVEQEARRLGIPC